MEESFALNLKEYIEQDKIYQDYKKGKLKEISDFDYFCIKHCENIENALDEILKSRIKINAMDNIENENQELKEEFAKLWDENNKLKDKYDKDIEYLGKIADDYRDKNKELKSLCDKYEEEHNTVFQDWQKDINIINELEKTLKEEVKGLYNEENPMLLDETYIKYATERKMAYMYILDKLNELKGDNK